MIELALLKMIHLLCVVYWLGGDLGVFYSSLTVVNEEKSPEVRIAAAKILFALDLAPRICMTLMLPSGIHLAHMMGRLHVPDIVVPISWVVCLAWLGMVLYLYIASGKRDLSILTRVDFYFRMLVVAVLATFCAYVWFIAESVLPGWLTLKLAIFTMTVVFGLMIRVKLKAFSPAFKKMVAGIHDRDDSRAISRSLRGSRPFVLAIWVGLLINTALSVKLL